MATLTIAATEDYRDGAPAIPTNTDSIVFANASVAFATFGGDQFGVGLIADDVAVTGNGQDNRFTVTLAGSFSAAAWTFSSWTLSGSFSVPADLVSLIGGAGNDTITGSSQQNVIDGGDGADALTGGAASDSFTARSGEVDAGEFINGGSGIDRIAAAAGAIDLSGATITDVEILSAGTDNTLTLNGDQLRVGAIEEVDGDTADTQAIIVNGSNVDLGGVTFTDWGGANQTITINGTSAADSLTGSDQNDTVNGGDGADSLHAGGGGVDTLNGGDGDDTFTLAIRDLDHADIRNGGNGTDTIEIPAGVAVGLTNETLTSIERLVFAAGNLVTLRHGQVGSGNITSVLGSSGADTFRIDGAFTIDSLTADLSAVSFLNWSGNDAIEVRGQAGNDTLTGSDKDEEFRGRGGDDIITGGLGADTLHGDDGNDVFKYRAGSEIASGEAIFGDGGTDTVQIENGGYDFSNVPFNVEVLQFVGATQATAIFEIVTASSVVGSVSVNDLVVNAVDLGTTQAFASLQLVSFASWTAGQDTIMINGLAGIDNILIGSSENDAINGGSLVDVMTGGDGNDIMTGGLGADTLNGGLGIDTAVFSGDRSSSTLHIVGNTIVVSGPDGADTLSSIENLQFADGTTSLVGDGSALFDTLFYLSQNADVFQAGIGALFHYNTFGFHEGRDPNAWFDTAGYLAVNTDVAAAGVNPLEHFHQVGWREGRDPSADFDTTLYLVNNPDVAAAGIDPLEHFLAHGISEGRQAFAAIGQSIVSGFDAQFYLFHNPDVAAAGVDPLLHYEVAGRFEGRNPNAWFDTAGYLSQYADVAAAGINPLLHYEIVGWTEGRDPSAGFDTLGYLGANPDVAAAGVNPLDHFLRFGVYEGRQPVNDGVFF
jgi:Ca2+-binding RTX toxin-like protein